ncbi:hypothetical protein D3C84_707190 [compost metagenome]
MLMPLGVGKSGRKCLPSCTSMLQRLAISTVFSSASGMSANSSAISSGDLRYCWSEKLRGRRGSSRTRPSPMQTRVSWASKSPCLMKRTSLVATRGAPQRPARATAACTCSSSLTRAVRCSSR